MIFFSLIQMSSSLLPVLSTTPEMHEDSLEMHEDNLEMQEDNLEMHEDSLETQLKGQYHAEGTYTHYTVCWDVVFFT